MIDGLKLTVTGEELRTLLDQRIEDHLRHAERWKREQARTPEQQTEDEPLLPDHMCENEAERHEWRADVLGFMRDHIDSGGWLEQEEYEERTSVGFHLGRLAKRVGELTPAAFAIAAGQRVAEEPGAQRVETSPALTP
jgi:hypothetical protein